MTNEKFYDIRKVVWISILIALALTAAVYLVSLNLGRFQSILLPDQGASWYYWKLPQISFWATLTVWILYAFHQVIAWRMIYKMRSLPKAPDGLVSLYNIKFLVVNAVFILLHLLQTYLFYDGLAQNVPVFSSQGSVIGMLVMILILLNARRGLFFGKKVKLPPKGVAGVLKIHGFYISWAIIYTFWFHPTEGTFGHILGFFYLFLLMIQMSLAKTSWHKNIKWITFLEVFVAFHGAIVALEAGNGMWPMFLFGFLMMFIVTQVYGIVFNKIALGVITAAYFAMAVLVFSGVLGNANTITDIGQITWIPLILYGLVFALVWASNWVMVLNQKIHPDRLSGK